MTEQEARFIPPSEWKGLNLLGLILTEVREALGSSPNEGALPSDCLKDSERDNSIGNSQESSDNSASDSFSREASSEDSDLL